jgi:hypothetical protein
VLKDAVQQLMLVPLEEMDEFLVAAMEVSGAELVFFRHFNHQDMAFLERGKCQILFSPKF